MTNDESRKTPPVDTAALRSLLAAATPGEWKTLGHDGIWRVAGADGETVFDDGSAYGEYDQKCTTADRDAILALRSAAPALLDAMDEVDRLRAALHEAHVRCVHLDHSVARLRDVLGRTSSFLSGFLLSTDEREHRAWREAIRMSSEYIESVLAATKEMT